MTHLFAVKRPITHLTSTEFVKHTRQQHKNTTCSVCSPVGCKLDSLEPSIDDSSSLIINTTVRVETINSDSWTLLNQSSALHLYMSYAVNLLHWEHMMGEVGEEAFHTGPSCAHVPDLRRTFPVPDDGAWLFRSGSGAERAARLRFAASKTKKDGP